MIVARLLTHNPASIDAVTSDDKMTALHLAACEGHEAIVAQLLNHSPGLIDLKTTYDQTALHIAAIQGHVKVVALSQILVWHSQVSVFLNNLRFFNFSTKRNKMILLRNK